MEMFTEHSRRITKVEFGSFRKATNHECFWPVCCFPFVFIY